MPSLPQLLQKLRKPNTQQSVAKKIGVTQSTLAHWEVGTRSPSPRHLQALLELVNASAEDRAQAWELLAQADAARSGEARPQAEAA